MNESGVCGWRVRTWEVEALLRAPMPTCLRAIVTVGGERGGKVVDADHTEFVTFAYAQNQLSIAPKL